MSTKEKNQNDKKMLKQEIYLELFNKKNQGMSKKLYQEAMYGLIYPTLKNYVNNNRNEYSNLTDEECEDLIMDVFISVIENSYQISEPDNYHAFVSKAKTKLKRWLETTNLNKSQTEEEILYDSFAETISHTNPLEDLIKDENARELRDCIDRLPDKASAIIKQRFFENLGYNDISKNLQMARDGVKVNEKKALSRLKKIIKDDLKRMLERQFVYNMPDSQDKKIMILRVIDRYYSFKKIADEMDMSEYRVRKIIEKYSAAMKNYVQENTIN